MSSQHNQKLCKDVPTGWHITLSPRFCCNQFGEFPGLRAATAASYCPGRPGELPKLIATEPRTQRDVSPCSNMPWYVIHHRPFSNSQWCPCNRYWLYQFKREPPSYSYPRWGGGRDPGLQDVHGAHEREGGGGEATRSAAGEDHRRDGKGVQPLRVHLQQWHWGMCKQWKKNKQLMFAYVSLWISCTTTKYMAKLFFPLLEYVQYSVCVWRVILNYLLYKWLYFITCF